MLHNLNLRPGKWCAALLCLLAVPALAQQVDVPAYKVLGCKSACAKWTDPVPLPHHLYGPSGDVVGPSVNSDQDAAGAFASDGYVLLRFTVTAQGGVKDPVLVKAIGSPEYARHSLEIVRAWQYKPATANGVPVDRPNWSAELLYTNDPWELGARTSVRSAYDEAKDLIARHRYADADAKLLPILSLTHLTFYERTMVSMLLSISYTDQNDLLTALEYAEDATLEHGKFLPENSRELAIRMRIRLEAATGQYGDALSWYDVLQKQAAIGSGDPDAKLIGQVKARLDDPAAIPVEGQIPVAGFLRSWDHTLLRRTFSFAGIQGTLDHFDLNCDQEMIESKLSTTAAWHVPESWSGCQLQIVGEPGAKFTVVESNK